MVVANLQTIQAAADRSLPELGNIIAELSDKVELHQLEQCSVIQEEGEELRDEIDTLRNERIANDERQRELKDRLKCLTIENRALKMEIKKRDQEIERLSACIKGVQEKHNGDVHSIEEETVEIDNIVKNSIDTLKAEKASARAVECVTIDMERMKMKVLQLRSQVRISFIHVLTGLRPLTHIMHVPDRLVRSASCGEQGEQREVSESVSRSMFELTAQPPASFTFYCFCYLCCLTSCLT